MEIERKKETNEMKQNNKCEIEQQLLMQKNVIINQESDSDDIDIYMNSTSKDKPFKDLTNFDNIKIDLNSLLIRSESAVSNNSTSSNCNEMRKQDLQHQIQNKLSPNLNVKADTIDLKMCNDNDATSVTSTNKNGSKELQEDDDDLQTSSITSQPISLPLLVENTMNNNNKMCDGHHNHLVPLLTKSASLNVNNGSINKLRSSLPSPPYKLIAGSSSINGNVTSCLHDLNHDDDNGMLMMQISFQCVVNMT